MGKRKERDEDEGEQEEARTVGGCMWAGELIWVAMCVCEGVGCLVGEKEGARGREGEK